MAWRQITFDANGGALSSGAPSSLWYYVSNDESTWYWTTERNGEPLEDLAIAKPIFSPHTFDGFWTGRDGTGVKFVSRNGYLQRVPHSSLPEGESVTVYAEWLLKWDVTDYFGLASSALVPFESDDGTARPHVVTRHYGRHTADARTSWNQGPSRITAEQSGPDWRNPTVKYMVVADTTLALYLGKAFPKETGTIYGPYLPSRSSEWRLGYHAGTTATGYMITSVRIETAKRRFPVVTVQGTANEGADAINKFFVKVPILARARAQNLLGAISGGGELQSLALAATCTPVVCQEILEPCASDVVDGHFEVHAETLAASGEAAPTFPAASYGGPDLTNGGFAPLGVPDVRSGTNYARYRISARREIV